MIKRLVIISIFFVAVLFFSACGTPRPQRTSFSYTGTVSQSGLSLIITTDNDAFKIRSTFLDLTPYLNKKVQIHGQFSQDVFFVDDVKPAVN
ncbi:MAG: hypothetical protein M1120_03705 [Patescibacteria group bacterium]|nr:hypothetical protein [Patescibacteria group bacterium]